MSIEINVALDVDGVLGNFEAHWHQCAEEVLGRPLVKVSEQHSLRIRYGLTGKEVDAVWRMFHEKWWADLPLYDHACELVYDLEDMGCTVWAVTSIDEQYSAARAESLCGLIPPARIVCVGSAPDAGQDAPALAKARVLRDMEAVAFLDDHPANANAAINAVNLTALLDRGYQGLESPEYGVTVIDDPMDFPVIVEEMLRRTGKIV
jgi:beta-phosphoglucomutase-like phosphatase (HAD superfamily)